MSKCCIPGCSTSSKKDLYQMPFADDELFEKWKENLPDGVNFEETGENTKFYICSVHFQDEFKVLKSNGKYELGPGAYPTIFEAEIPKTRKQLIDHANNCRFCLKQISGNDDELPITENIKKLFNNITNFELRSSQVYSQRVCRKCSKDLRYYSLLKDRLINNQKKLYKIFESFENEEHDPEEIKVEANKSFGAIEYSGDKDGAQDESYEIVKFEHSEDVNQYDCFEVCEEEKPEISADVQRVEKKRDKKSFNKEKVLCPECGLYFTRASLRTHRERVHLKLKRYECDICGRQFYLKDAIKEHLKTHGGVRNHHCTQCQKSFLTRGSLKMHYDKTHLQKYIVYCDFCSKKFTNKGNFRIHIRSAHTGERPYACDYENCGKAFFSIYELRTHRNNVHCPPVQCSICQKTFSSPNTLKSHMKLSHSEKNIVCQTCGKRYHTNYLLRQHLKVHTGEKNYYCVLCSQTYYKSADLNRHYRAFHMKVKLKCEIANCSSQFARKETYKSHVLSHHKDIGQEMTTDLLERIKNLQLPKIDMSALTTQ